MSDEAPRFAFVLACRGRAKPANLAALLLLGLVVAVAPAARGESSVRFSPISLPLETYHVYDLLVADLNADGILDVVTTNHNARQSHLVGDGAGGFVDRGTEWGLQQDPAFPGFEDGDREPPVPGSGVHVYWHRRQLVIRASGVTPEAPVEGELEVASPVEVVKSRGFEVETHREATAGGIPASRVKFASRTDGRLVVKPEFVAIPMRFSIRLGSDAQRIFVGSKAVPAASARFEVRLRDRHAYAVADRDADGRIDVAITRGGLKGRMASFPFEFFAELRSGSDSFRVDRAAEKGLRNTGCSSRQTSWVDADRDGRLDLHVVCARDQENRLYHQREDGSFEDRAAQLGLASRSDGPAVWFDADSDGDPDLFLVEDRAFTLFENRPARFVRSVVRRDRGAAKTSKLSLGDYDADGDLDLFVASQAKSWIAKRTGATWRFIAAKSVGLRSRTRTANWVDVDGDGRLDVHQVPGGLYLQNEAGTFSRIDALPGGGEPGPIHDARVAWFDVDGDGDRDLLQTTLTTSKPGPGRWNATFLRNDSPARSWLQIDLVGPPGNRAAIGSSVRIRTGNRVTAHVVGESEGSHFSQGHHRLYRGLGAVERVDDVTVTWPDGTTTSTGPRSANRRIVIEQPVSSPR